MEGTKGRSFITLKSSMKEEEFQKFRKKIAEEYANSACEYARSYFLKQYEISQECYYQILSSVVIENIVSDETVEKMELKALANQKTHAVNAGLSTRKHYNNLRRLRLENMELSKFGDEEIKQIATKFAYSPLNKTEFAKENQIAVRILSLLLEKAIVEVIIDDLTYQAIRKRSFDRASEGNKKIVKNYFSNLARKRNSNKQKLFSD